MPSCALLVCRVGAIPSASAATTNRIATPVAPHLNFSRRAMRLRFQFTPALSSRPSEGRRRDHSTPRDTQDGEGLVERRHDLIVLVKWRIRDIQHVARLYPELLSDKDRHWLLKVQPKNTGPRPWIALDIPHPEDEHAGLVGALVDQAA